MKKYLALLAISLVCLSSAVTPASSSAMTLPVKEHYSTLKPTPVENADLDFVLSNQTGYAIASLELSPADTKEWGENILKGELPDKSEVKISFHPQASATKWDLQITWKESDGGGKVYWNDLDLTGFDKLTLKYDEKTGKTTAFKD